VVAVGAALGRKCRTTVNPAGSRICDSQAGPGHAVQPKLRLSGQTRARSAAESEACIHLPLLAAANQNRGPSFSAGSCFF
jgi:hypothetical protein